MRLASIYSSLASPLSLGDLKLPGCVVAPRLPASDVYGAWCAPDGVVDSRGMHVAVATHVLNTPVERQRQVKVGICTLVHNPIYNTKYFLRYRTTTSNCDRRAFQRKLRLLTGVGPFRNIARCMYGVRNGGTRKGPGARRVRRLFCEQNVNKIKWNKAHTRGGGRFSSPKPKNY